MRHLGYKTTWIFVSFLLLGAVLGRALLSGHLIKKVAALETKDAHVLSVAFSPDGKWLAVGLINVHSWEELWKGSVRLWRVGHWEESHDLPEESLPAVLVAFSPDGKWLAVAYASLPNRERKHNAFVTIYDTESFDHQKTLEFPEGMFNKSAIYDMAFSPDGKFLATYDDSRESKLWSVPSFERAPYVEIPGIRLAARQVFPAVKAEARSSNGTVEAKCNLQDPPPECIVTVRTTIGGDVLATSLRDAGHYCSVAFSPDDRLIAVGTGRQVTLLLNPFK